MFHSPSHGGWGRRRRGFFFFFNPTINPIKLDEKCAAILRYEVNITATEISDLKLVQHCVDY